LVGLVAWQSVFDLHFDPSRHALGRGHYSNDRPKRFDLFGQPLILGAKALDLVFSNSNCRNRDASLCSQDLDLVDQPVDTAWKTLTVAVLDLAGAVAV